MIGYGTYAFFWRHSDQMDAPLDLRGALEATRADGVDLFQICDYAPLLDLDDAGLREVRRVADDLGIALELGTKGIPTQHLERFLGLAEALDVTLVRSMVTGPDTRPTLTEAEAWLRAALPVYERAGVRLALETYEQLHSRDLVALVEQVGSASLGICLDPANCVANLELPADVIRRCAPYVLNLHIKDFAFSRRDGWVGFTYAGAELGSGRLDYDELIAVVDPETRGINRIVEHWLPWQGSAEETARAEARWTEQSLHYMKEKDHG